MTILPAEDADFASLLAGDGVRGMMIAEGGIGPEPIIEMLRGVASRVRPDCDPAAWWIVEGMEVVGLCSVVSASPAEASIDIGYGVASSQRGRGVATRAIGEVLTWARSRSELTSVTAETSIDNLASQRVLEQNGFVRIGERTDAEDGDLICWRASVKA